MRILLVESDAFMRNVISELLKSDCFEILEAGDGETAIGIAQLAMPDLIVCALRLRGINGFDFIKLVKSDPVTCAIPVIVLTGDILPQTVKRVTELGVAAYLPKPNGMDVLLETVNTVLERQ